MNKIFSLTIILAIAANVFAQEKTIKAFTVKEAVEYALQFNNSVKNAKLGVDEAKWRNIEIYTTGFPKINANFDYNYYFKQPVSPALSKIFSEGTMAKVFGAIAYGDGVTPGNPVVKNILENSGSQSVSFVLPHNISTGLQVNQLLFDGRYVFGIKASKDLMRTARLSSKMSDQEVKYAVLKAYYQAEAAQEAKSLLQKNLGLIDTLLLGTQATYREGLIEELDLNRVELIQANLQSQINIQNQMAEVALANLKFQMGMSLNDEIILKDNLTELKKEITPELSAQFDAKNRIEYQLLETAIKLKGYDMRQKRVQYFPSLYSFLSYGWNSQSQSGRDLFKKDSWFDQGLVGITLKLPIFDSGEKLAQVKQAKIEQMKTQNDFENFKNASELQYKAAQSGFSSALADEANTKRTEELSRKIFNKNAIKFKEGIGNSFELVQSETEYVTNQLKYIQSSLNLLNTKADLDKAMGK